MSDGTVTSSENAVSRTVDLDLEGAIGMGAEPTELPRTSRWGGVSHTIEEISGDVSGNASGETSGHPAPDGKGTMTDFETFRAMLTKSGSQGSRMAMPRLISLGNLRSDNLRGEGPGGLRKFLGSFGGSDIFPLIDEPEDLAGHDTGDNLSAQTRETRMAEHIDELKKISEIANSDRQSFPLGAVVELKPGCEKVTGTGFPFDQSNATSRIGVVVRELSRTASPADYADGVDEAREVFGIRWDYIVAVKDTTDGEINLVPIDSRFFRIHKPD